MLHQNDLELSEGDVINIESSSDFQAPHYNFFDYYENKKFVKPEKQREAKDIVNKKFLDWFGNLSYNFTFLIELDPL